MDLVFHGCCAAWLSYLWICSDLSNLCAVSGVGEKGQEGRGKKGNRREEAMIGDALIHVK
ncbi:hypothetical protein A2U01_0025873 [Trifolium medium]|uniref:Uncharacterized protein n=1 Tax=Trifolium medium TaxID=97028 RepID=A0A392P1Z3_9FABA|nr:hypothetical protein [Trifolium medium]